MEPLKHFQRRKSGVRPHRIVFEKENSENDYVSWEKQMKPHIALEGITPEERQILDSRMDEMLEQAEEILLQYYLDPNSEDCFSAVDSFPDIRYLTGNYYVSRVYYASFYNCVYKDKSRKFNCYPNEIKDGKAKDSYYAKESPKRWVSLKDLNITKQYQIILSLALTGDYWGKEDDYMGLDLDAVFDTPDAPIEFEILEDSVI